MQTHARRSLSLLGSALSLATLLAGCGPAPGASVVDEKGSEIAADYSSGFLNASGLTLNGAAQLVGPGGGACAAGSPCTVRLSQASQVDSRSSVFLTNKLDARAFTINARLKFSGNLDNPGDGFTITVQNEGPNALGGIGGGLGYGPDPDLEDDNPARLAKITKSVAVKFDVWSNLGEGTNTTGLFVGGASPAGSASVSLSPSGVNLASGNELDVTLAYAGTSLVQTIKDVVTGSQFTKTYTVDIPAELGGTSGHFGFTAATGATTIELRLLSFKVTAPCPAGTVESGNACVATCPVGTYDCNGVCTANGTCCATPAVTKLLTTRRCDADCNYRRACLVNADLKNVTITSSADFTMAHMTGADMTNASLTGMGSLGTRFTEAQMDGIKMTNATLQDLHLQFSSASMVGAKLDGAKLTAAGNMAFIGANLSNSNLKGVELRTTNGQIWLGKLDGADLSGALLDAKGAQSAGNILMIGSQVGANLTNATLKAQFDISLGGNWTGAILSGVNAVAQDDVFLSGGDFTNANLSGATFTGTRGLSTQSAKFVGASLVGAKLQTVGVTPGLGSIMMNSASFSNANLTNAAFLASGTGSLNLHFVNFCGSIRTGFTYAPTPNITGTLCW